MANLLVSTSSRLVRETKLQTKSFQIAVVNSNPIQDGDAWGRSYTLPETNNSHLKMDSWKISFLLGWPIFRCKLAVSFREWFLRVWTSEIFPEPGPKSWSKLCKWLLWPAISTRLSHHLQSNRK